MEALLPKPPGSLAALTGFEPAKQGLKSLNLGLDDRWIEYALDVAYLLPPKAFVDDELQKPIKPDVPPE